MIAARISLPTLLMLAFVFPSGAQAAAKETPAARAVKMFNVFCLSQLPDLDGVQKAAGFGEFAPITGDELKAHVHIVRGTIPEAQFAWRFHDAAGEYILTAVQSKLDDESRKERPAFADAKVYACTLTYPPTDPLQVLAQLNALLKRPPDPSGHSIRYMWTHETAKHLSRVEWRTRAGAEELSASVLVKP